VSIDVYLLEDQHCLISSLDWRWFLSGKLVARLLAKSDRQLCRSTKLLEFVACLT